MKKISSLLTIIPLTSCVQNVLVLNTEIFCFDTMIDVTLNQGKNQNLDDIEELFNYYDSISDSYHQRSEENIHTINKTNEPVDVSSELYALLQCSFTVKDSGATYFNPLIGSLSEKWKEALDENRVLSESVISEELVKISSSSLDFLDNNQVRRNGDAQIDLGGIAKGYSLDIVKNYLKDNNIKNYLINAGSSSILVGEKKSANNGLYRIGLPKKEYPNHHIKVKNCVISTSGSSEQGKTIERVKYSHIINPITGNAVNNYDSIIVVSEDGYLGDALSTSMMFNTIEEIKAVEQAQNVKVIVIKDHQLLYRNEDLQVYKN